MTLAKAYKTISVGYPCEHHGVDAFVTAKMHEYLMPKYDSEQAGARATEHRTEPFERGLILKCGTSGVYVSSRANSNPYRNNSVPDDVDSSRNIYTPSNVVSYGINICRTPLDRNDLPGAIAVTHSHPYFHSIGQFNAGYDSNSKKEPKERGGCHGGTAVYPNPNLSSWNQSGADFSDGDKRYAEYYQLPIYLLSPNGYIKLYTNQRSSNLELFIDTGRDVASEWLEYPISNPPVSIRPVMPTIPTIPHIPPIFPSFNF